MYILQRTKKMLLKNLCDNNLLSPSNKKDKLSKTITEVRKIEFDEVTNKTVQHNKAQVNDEIIDEFFKTKKMKLQKKWTFEKKLASDNVAKNNYLKLDFDKKK